jgi:hypothetical protein
VKTIHHLKARWLIAAMLVAVAIGEFVAWQVTKAYHLHFSPVAVAAVCVGLVAAGAALLYDGTE